MKARIALLIVVLLGVIAWIPDGEANPNGWEERFFEANQAYKEGRYQEAVEKYEALIAAGYEDGTLYYNLGNAYFRQGQIGRAILNYERARILMPRGPDLNFNLQNARDHTLDAIEESPGFVRMIFFWLDHVSPEEVFWGFAIVNVLFWSILLVRLFFRSEWTYYVLVTLLVFWLMAVTSFALKWIQNKTDDRAVVLLKEIIVRSGPNAGDTVLFKIHEGTVVHYERSEDGWALIHLPGNKRGWVKIEGIEQVKRKNS